MLVPSVFVVKAQWEMILVIYSVYSAVDYVDTI